MQARSIPLPFALAALGPVAIGAIVAATSGTVTPLAATPAIVFGVLAVTAPALYIAITAAGNAPSLAAIVRALGTALGAFGMALAGLVLPATFLALSAVTLGTTLAVATAALATAGVIAMRRLHRELDAARPPTVRTSWTSRCVFAVWAFATLGIAADMWWSLATEVAS